jgi:hypothetical protein
MNNLNLFEIMDCRYAKLMDRNYRYFSEP